MIDLIPQVATLADQFNRPITYLRVSVTDRCNLRCVYCMPEAGLPWVAKAEILTFEEITSIVRAAAAIGVRSIRLTGGEPLVRRDLPRLVARIATVPAIDDIALSTNGLLLAAQIDVPRCRPATCQHLARHVASRALPRDRAAARSRPGVRWDRRGARRGLGTDQAQLRRDARAKRRRADREEALGTQR